MASTVYDAILGALTLRQITRTSHNGNNQVIAGKSSGAPAPSELFAGISEPMASFDSMDVAGVIGAVDMAAGLSVLSGTITIPFNKRANGGTFASGTSHPALSGTDALIVPTQFSANQDDEGASASLDVHFISSDGTTEPVAEATGQSLASQSFNAMYALGPASINATSIPEIVGISVNPGITVQKQRHTGFNYPTAIFIDGQDPFIDFIFEDLDALATYSAQFTAMTAAVAYLRKRDGVGFSADVNLDHIQFSFADGIVAAQTIQASGVNRGQATLRCWGEALTATSGVAIT